MANGSNKEPVYTASITGGAASGTSILLLQDPIRDILLEIGASDRLAIALVKIMTVVIPVSISIATAWWARKRTVPVVLANEQIEKAFDMPANSPQHKLEELKVGTDPKKEK